MQRDAADSRCGENTHRRRESEAVGSVIDISERRAAVHAGQTRCWIDAHPAHPAQIDDEPIVASTETGDIVATAANGEWQACVARHVDAGNDIGSVHAPNDQRWTTI